MFFQQSLWESTHGILGEETPHRNVVQLDQPALLQPLQEGFQQRFPFPHKTVWLLGSLVASEGAKEKTKEGSLSLSMWRQEHGTSSFYKVWS